MTAYPLDDRAHSDLDADTLQTVYDRVEGYLLVDNPEFGSHDWAQLERSDPAWSAAVVKAALAWWSARVFGNGVPADVLDAEIRRRHNAASKDVAGYHDVDTGVGWPELMRQHLATQRAKRYRQQHPYGAGGDAA